MGRLEMGDATLCYGDWGRGYDGYVWVGLSLQLYGFMGFSMN